MTDEWRAALDGVDAALIDGYQSGLPVAERPLREIAADLGVTERAVLDRIRRLRERGIVRRFGPVLNPPVIGSSTLAALRVPEDRFDGVAATVNGHRQVNHNYRRDHAWNMWFVVTAGSRARRDAVLDDIAERTGLSPLHLPMRTDYYIDLEFPVVNDDRFARESGSGTAVEATAVDETARADLTALEADLLVAVQDGLPLSRTPYRDVAAAADAPLDAVLDAVERLLATGCIKRLGCVVNHLVTGFDSNCMVVWDVPDDRVDERGRAVGALPSVTLCYRRPRRPDRGWSYNLFTMIHGREAAAVDERIDALAADHLPYDHERLYSTETLKQTGARYEELLAGGPGDADAEGPVDADGEADADAGADGGAGPDARVR